MTDLGVGIVLLVVIPALVYIGKLYSLSKANRT
jgi:hypothetical protein